MAKDNQADKQYIEQELEEAQKNTSYGEASAASAEQYESPEPMSINRRNSHRGQKSRSQGYKG